MTSDAKTETDILKYRLQACRNLEGEMLALGWPTDAAHFRQRSREVSRELKKRSGSTAN
jgi:hypothetical protein